jgi:hypothetical protein
MRAAAHYMYVSEFKLQLTLQVKRGSTQISRACCDSTRYSNLMRYGSAVTTVALAESAFEVGRTGFFHFFLFPRVCSLLHNHGMLNSFIVYNQRREHERASN